ncbi:MAG TPA: hypothetical protein VM532_17565 [Burkholderiales bacterium]|nr:hypothetical protein [Burkholderiales bacterium]
MPKPPITPDIALTLGPHQKGADGAKKKKGYKPHEKIGANNDFLNITELFRRTGKPVDLSHLDPNQKYIWVLANVGDATNPRMELILGREHKLSELRTDRAEDPDMGKPGPSTDPKPSGPTEEPFDLDEYFLSDHQGDVETYLASRRKNIAAAEPAVETRLTPDDEKQETKQEGETKTDEKGKDKAKSEKEKMMGHATLAHDGYMAGEAVVETTDRLTFRFLEWPLVIKQKPGRVLTNKSGRMGEGNRPAREAAGIHKNDLLELAATMFQVQTTGFDLVGTRLIHHKTDLMKTVYDAHEKHPHLVPFVLPQRSKWQHLPVDQRLMPIIQDIATMDAEAVAAKFGGDKGKNIQPIDELENIPTGRNTLGVFVGQDTDGNFYFKDAIQQATATFNKVAYAAMPADIHSELAQPIPSASVGPTTVILQLGKSPPREFNNTVQQAIAAKRGTPDEPPLAPSTKHKPFNR